MKRAGAALFALALLYPLAGLFARVGPWRWNLAAMLAPVRVSLGLTALAMLIVVALGTPMAHYIARAPSRERIAWQAVLLISVLLPPLALGILLSLAFGAHFANTAIAFVVTQVYVSIGYYVLGAIAALERVPRALEVQAGLLGRDAWSVFWRVTFPVARLGFAVALSLAWVRALTEFGAVVITAYYPAGMPVAIWVNLQNFGLPAVMPLMVVFLATALPLPWLVHVLAQRRVREANRA
ncbi:MAG TPA: ABC transporter permease subunit [Candidatus Baltobacteraceae bacterium]|nr:ABC transporter permease subunit [Candidatus Baltobacteraceae bacterium]